MKKKSKKGICCACQSEHDVIENNTTPEDEMDTAFGPYGCGEAGFYVMAPHRIFGDTGQYCDGEGTVPQAVFDDNLESNSCDK